MLLFSKGAKYRKDGIDWKKKKNGKAIAENHEKLRVQGVELLRCCYVHCAPLPSFHRRAYSLLHPPAVGDKGLVLVHYLNEGPPHRYFCACCVVLCCVVLCCVLIRSK